jgi:predicted phage terminase large subunit-like protein
MRLSPSEYRAIVRSDLHTFLVFAFSVLNPETEFFDSWHIELINQVLTDCVRRKTKRLIINLPPRSLKSLCASVAFPAWLLGHNPSAQVLCASYSQALADKHALDTRTLMMSPGYKAMFPGTQLSSTKFATNDFKTSQNGFRLATSVGGTLTGRGADFIIIDDPLKPDEAFSDTQRQSVNDWYDHSLISRLNDKRNGCTILIMQRLHEDDLVGHLLDSGGWDLLRFPAIAEEEERFEIRRPDGRIRTITRHPGEALHPEREPLSTLYELKKNMGEYNFAGQYQQSPAPLGGGILKREWIKEYSDYDRPEFESIIQSWDTGNKPEELNDPSACTTWGVKDHSLYLLDVICKHLGYPELKRFVVSHARLFGAKTIIIEDKASGTQLIQDLRNDGMSGLKKYCPKFDKKMRFVAATGYFEDGFVYLPKKAHWLDAYTHELLTFPNGKHDDQVDSTSQAIDWFKEHGVVRYGLIEWYKQQAEGSTVDPQYAAIFTRPRGAGR